MSIASEYLSKRFSNGMNKNIAKAGKATQFKLGNNANPNGAPKRRPIAAAIRELIEKDGCKQLRAIAKTAVDAAEDGDWRFAKEIMDRIDGKVADKIEHSGRVDSLITQEKFEDMDDERKARLLRTAGITAAGAADLLRADDGADTGAVDSGPE